MSWPHIIGFSGPARSGKDTAASWLLDRGYKRYSFAMPLKCGLQTMLGLTVAHTDGDLKESIVEPYGVSARHMMQTIGTEWGRVAINDRIWLLRAEQVIAEWRAADPGLRGVVISDVRFENEADWVREQGGLVIHLRRSGLAQVGLKVPRSWRERLFSTPWRPLAATKPHPSEAGAPFKDGDRIALNDGTIDELHDQLDGIMRAFSDGQGEDEGQVEGGAAERRVSR